MTIDQGADMSRYQGLVALDGGTLEDAAHEYFLRSEQIPTRVRLAVAEELSRRRRRRAIAGAPAVMLLQFLPRAPERARVRRPRSRRCSRRRHAARTVTEDDAWVEGRSLVETVEDIELIDPAVSTERLLYRLFHERGVRVFTSSTLDARMLVLARQRRGRCCARSRRTTATTWSRTA